MSDIPKRSEYYLSPDGVRKLSQLMKQHFAGYSSKDKLYNDSKGLQYNGSVYNFGSEILLETNKLKMTRPPIRNLSYGTDTTFYFDIKYSDIINTYEQQNLLSCYLKKDTLVSSHEYYIVFNNVTEFFVIRSTNTSAGNTFNPSKGSSVVFKDKYWKTNDFPILVETYDDNGETVTIEHELSIRDGESYPTFYFHSTDLTDGFIDSIVDNTLTTIKLVDEYNGLPFIWFTTESFEYLPKLDLSNNVDTDGHPFLTFGTDGNGVSRIYPNCYENNFPPYDPIENYEWYLKVESKDGFSFIPDDEPGNKSMNYQIPIKSISLLYSRLVNGEPEVINTIEIPDDGNVVVYIDDCSTYVRHSNWEFEKRNPNDWDWDPITLHNPNYACHIYDLGDFSWYTFSMNHMDGWMLRPGFRIKFLNDYLYKWESALVGSVSGIHVDATDERSNNGIIEKNGVSHMMGEFDGLPIYMNKQLDRTIHHSHVDIYSIRDHNNLWTQLPMKKQTSGMILDSAIPQNELPDLINVDPSIKYNNIVSNQYDTDTSTIVSLYNVLSNITYIDAETNVFADYTNKGIKKYKRFFYHGNNYFSLDVFGLDPLTEYARGYLISNDDAKYENNDETSYPKPGRTIARICDIPTTMIQLTNIPDYAPSILIDWNTSYLPYVRTFCNYEINDIERIRNNPYDTLIKYNDIVPYNETDKRYNDIIFPNGYDITNVLNETGDRYKHKSHLSETLTLTFGNGGNTRMVVNETGDGYDNGDTFKFNIGGRYFTGIVVESISGKPTVVTTYDSNDGTNVSINDINVSNLPNAISAYKTTTISGNGDGLIINLEIDNNVWSEKQPTVDNDYNDGLHLYQYDEYEHIWLYVYDNQLNTWKQSIQITGPLVKPNPYDLNDTHERKMVDVYVMNSVNNNRKLLYNTPISVDSSYSLLKRTIETDIPTSMIGMDDISETLNSININYQNSYYTPYIDNDKTNVKIYSRYPYTIQDTHYGDYHSYVLPRFNTLNLPSYFNTTNRILWSIHKDKTKSQPDLWYYNPNETNFIQYDNVSTDYNSISSSRKLTYYDIMKDSITVQSTRYITNENIYRYNEYESDSFNELQIMLNNKTRDELLTYIRVNYGDDAFPLKVDAYYPFTKSMLVGYCLTTPISTYSKSSIKMVAQKYTTIAQLIENPDGSETIVPTGGEPITGMFESLSYSIHDLNYKTTSSNNFDSSILFVFTIMKNDQLVSLKHFHLYDENGNDISNLSLIIYDGKKYLFDEETDNWRQPI